VVAARCQSLANARDDSREPSLGGLLLLIGHVGHHHRNVGVDVVRGAIGDRADPNVTDTQLLQRYSSQLQSDDIRQRIARNIWEISTSARKARRT